MAQMRHFQFQCIDDHIHETDLVELSCTNKPSGTEDVDFHQLVFDDNLAHDRNSQNYRLAVDCKIAAVETVQNSGVMLLEGAEVLALTGL